MGFHRMEDPQSCFSANHLSILDDFGVLPFKKIPLEKVTHIILLALSSYNFIISSCIYIYTSPLHSHYSHYIPVLNDRSRLYPRSWKLNPTIYIVDMCIRICTYVYMSICLYVYMSICLYVYMSICLYVYMSIGIYVYMYICVYAHMYVYIYI